MSCITGGMWGRWLVDGPVVEWWVNNWVFGTKLNKSAFSRLLVKIELIWANSDFGKSELLRSHGVFSQH
jgi:hypothetical protein